MKCDVLIAGGGSAGIAAAIAAARCGAQTVLVERHGATGGMATASLVHSICGLYFLQEELTARPATLGIPMEIASRLITAGASPGPVRMGRMDVLPHSPPGFAAVADSLLADEPSLQVHLHSELSAVQINAASIRIEAICRGQRLTYEASVLVDASGDAAAASMAGAITLQADATRLQRPAFVFAMHSVDTAALDDEGRIRLANHLTGAVMAGRLHRGALGAQFRATGRGSELYATIDLAAPADYDPLDPRQLTALEQEGRRIAWSLRDFLRTSHPSFRSAEIAAFPSRVGIRESRRLQGRETVSASDVLEGREHPQSIALGTWPMEIREKATGPRWRYPAENRPAHIPLGALQSSDYKNLWVAGRCISCDHEAQASLRVMGTCMATGQAAGIAAAMQADGRDVTAEIVRERIQLWHREA